MTNEAACAVAVREGIAEPDDWFPGLGQVSKRNNRAMQMCFTCPVQQECLELSLNLPDTYFYGGPYGIWGGATAAQRNRMRTRRAA